MGFTTEPADAGEKDTAKRPGRSDGEGPNTTGATGAHGALRRDVPLPSVAAHRGPLPHNQKGTTTMISIRRYIAAGFIGLGAAAAITVGTASTASAKLNAHDCATHYGAYRYATLHGMDDWAAVEYAAWLDCR